MKAMYSSAMLVRVWLGEGAEGNDEGITVFEKLFQGENPPFGNIRIDGKPLNVDRSGREHRSGRSLS